MILKIAPDLRRIKHHRYAEAGKVSGRPDARQHQELRRVDGSAAQDDLALRPDRLAHALPNYLDAFCPTTPDDDPRRDGLRQQVEIAALVAILAACPIASLGPTRLR